MAAAPESSATAFLPDTLRIDDPGSTTSCRSPRSPPFKTGDDPSFKQRDISGEFSKRITEAFGFVRRDARHLSAPGGLTGMGADGFESGADVQIPPVQNTRCMSS